MRFVAATVGMLAMLGLTQAADDPSGVEFFEKKVRPVLVEHCYKCHSTEAKKPKGGLFVDSRAALLKGGDNGPALVPGQPDKSRLIEAIGYKNVELRMPPKGKLSDAAVADLTAWVKMSAPWPAEKGKTAAAREEFDLGKRKQAHWAWRPIQTPPPPAVKNGGWPRSDSDRFILAKLEEKGIAPAPAAERRTLIRRVYFDLIGLPPTPQEVEIALNDQSGEWFEKVVDRLLSSQQFGERWARHWLDLVRYGESRGHEFDYLAPNAWQYRDYVIRALNADVPHNQFVVEQIAGDLLEQPRLHPKDGFNESILGTGFWFLGEQVHSPVDIRQDEADRFDNMVDVLSKTFLGLTVSCARCHDHKFDAISTKDYYALYGFLQSSSYRLARFESMDHNRRIARELAALRDRQRAPTQKAIADEMKPGIERLADYLLAARTVLLGKQLDDVARERKLDSAQLGEWVNQLRQSAKDANDPLHLWARVALDAAADQPQRLAELLKRPQGADAPRAGIEIMVDYAKLPPTDWLPDGDAFGLAPVRPGDVRFGSDPSRPIERIFDYAAAEKDPTWDRLKLAPGAENDPGPLGGAIRAGRTLRTPTFPLTTGRLFYLVKGNGRIYASVDSHAMINGPLHGKVVQNFKTAGQFQWIGHDLSPYQGHRIHVEFTATDGDCAIARIVQTSGAAPPLPAGPSPIGLVEPVPTTVEELAKSCAKVTMETVERLAADKIQDGRAGSVSDRSLTDARLANWLITHPSLFGIDSKRLSDKVAPLLAEQAKLIAQIKPDSRLAMSFMDGSGEDEYVFIRGAHKAPGPVVPRRFLEALAGPEKLAIARGSGRLELARQMVDPKLNPFITRVLVNRLWHHLFGRGIVGSVDNFGVLGEAPTHPELLDHLADQFAREGWSIKKMIRALVLSSSYRMSSQVEEKAEQADVQNLLLHRARIRRLEGEAIRDAMLSISGRLKPTMFGPPVPVYLTSFMEGRGRPGSGPLDGDGRRSLYIAIRRNFLTPMMLAFDTPIPFSTVGRRTVSNVPAQSLILMNDPFVQEQAKLWAKKALAQPGTPRERLTLMYQSAYARPPSESEVAACLEFLEGQAKLYASNGGRPEADLAAWADLAHVLFNAKEFIFVN